MFSFNQHFRDKMILIIINEKRVCILGVYNPNMKSFPYMPYPNINMIDRCPEILKIYFFMNLIQTIYDFNLT